MPSNGSVARVSALRVRGLETRLHKTRMKEMPFAGHPNVGTAFVLASQATKLPARFLFKERGACARLWSAIADLRRQARNP